MPIDRIVLLGFMSSGKSTTGEALARRLGWRFLDFDSTIAAREERSVRTIVEFEGEGYFRRLERSLTREVAREREIVLAPGGGWIMQPELLAEVRPGALVVWLRISPEETMRRLELAGREHPLEGDPDPLRTIRLLLQEREPLYRRADLTIPGEGRTVEGIAFEIEVIVRIRS